MRKHAILTLAVLVLTGFSAVASARERVFFLPGLVLRRRDRAILGRGGAMGQVRSAMGDFSGAGMYKLIVSTGFLLPLVVMVAAFSICGPDWRFLETPLAVFALLPLLLFNGFPFVLYAEFLRSRWSVQRARDDKTARSHILGAVLAGGVLLATSLVILSSYWVPLACQESASSTSGIALVLFPLYALIFCPVAYVCGRILGHLLPARHGRRGNIE